MLETILRCIIARRWWLSQSCRCFDVLGFSDEIRITLKVFFNLMRIIRYCLAV